LSLACHPCSPPAYPWSPKDVEIINVREGRASNACGEQHLQRYLDEFTFRWNNRSKLGIEDEERARAAAYGMNDKRLTYRWTEAG
jgi:hypothetical protein